MQCRTVRAKRRAHQFAANCKFMSFFHLGVPHIAVITTARVKQDGELLLDEYGESYWDARDNMGIKHWHKATPAYLKSTYGGLEGKDPRQQHSSVCGTHYLVPDPEFRRELDAVREAR